MRWTRGTRAGRDRAMAAARAEGVVATQGERPAATEARVGLASARTHGAGPRPGATAIATATAAPAPAAAAARMALAATAAAATALAATATAATTLAATAAPASAQATIGGEWRSDVAAFAERVVDAGLAPGMGVAVARGDWVVYDAGFGAADLASGRPATGDTPFYIASSTKSLTALAASLAIHRGELDPDAPMVRYLPAARLPADVPRESIAVRDLISLTHGLSGSGPVVIRTAYTGEFTHPQLLELLRFHEATGEHGSFDYNNLGFNLLGMVLQARYGVDWKQVVRREVLEPIGMDRTSAYVSRLDPDAMAQPHGWTPVGFERVRLGKQDANMHAAGGHFASARDLARYLAVHMSGGLVDGRRVLPEEAVRATHRTRVTQDRRFGPFRRIGWGWGWDIGLFEGDTLIHRFGGFSGYRAHMSFMPEHDVGVVVLVNGGGPASPAADLVATYAYDRLLGKPGVEARFDARLDSLLEQAREDQAETAAHLAERRARLAPLPHPLSAYAGTYVSPELGTMEWRVVGGGLEVRMGAVHSRAEVFDAAANRLRIEVGGGEVAEFTFPPDGPAESVTLIGLDETFVRVEGGR